LLCHGFDPQAPDFSDHLVDGSASGGRVDGKLDPKDSAIAARSRLAAPLSRGELVVRSSVLERALLQAIGAGEPRRSEDETGCALRRQGPRPANAGRWLAVLALLAVTGMRRKRCRHEPGQVPAQDCETHTA
jgi:hypothetical protein